MYAYRTCERIISTNLALYKFLFVFVFVLYIEYCIVGPVGLSRAAIFQLSVVDSFAISGLRLLITCLERGANSLHRVQLMQLPHHHLL